jgi:hypothetical protein
MAMTARGLFMVGSPGGWGQAEWGQPPPAQPMPRAGQVPEPHGGGANDRDGGGAEAGQLLFSLREPQWGQTGLRAAVTSCSNTSPQDLQMYSKSGMGRGTRVYCAAVRASMRMLAWRMPVKSATFLPSLKMTR